MPEALTRRAIRYERAMTGCADILPTLSSPITHVTNEQGPNLLLLLDCVPLKHEGEPGHSYFMRNTWTTRTADDEDVVFELFMLISRLRRELDWTINWDVSDY